MIRFLFFKVGPVVLAILAGLMLAAYNKAPAAGGSTSSTPAVCEVTGQ
ncbi:hypothetical protein [Microtetraspora malaysiensis]